MKTHDYSKERINKVKQLFIFLYLWNTFFSLLWQNWSSWKLETQTGISQAAGNSQTRELWLSRHRQIEGGGRSSNTPHLFFARLSAH
jgi:hypothetical protein